MELTRARIVALGIFVAVAAAAITALLRSERSGDLVLRIDPIDDSGMVTVYVGGAVRQPDLYTLPRGARVAEAVAMAGVVDDGDTTGMPLADRVQDGQELYVPRHTATPVRTTGDSVGGTPTTAPNAPININTASAAELATLPGIGPALAQRIIEYRTENGPFESIEALEGVRGISARMVEELRGLITTGS